jgi:hypothetical protein
MRVLGLAAALALAAWTWLALLRGGYWRTDIRLPDGQLPARWPAVAVVVPARNEASVLPLSLPTILAQRYPGPLQVILVDDGSTDGTGGLARKLTAGRGEERSGSAAVTTFTLVEPGRRRRDGRGSCGRWLPESTRRTRSTCSCSPTRMSRTSPTRSSVWYARPETETSCPRWRGCAPRLHGSG